MKNVKNSLLLLGLLAGISACNNGGGGNSPQPTAGQLIFNNFNLPIESGLSYLGIGQGTNVTLALVNSYGVSLPTQVEIFATESTISVSPSQCWFNSQTNLSCDVTVTGVESGTANVGAIAWVTLNNGTPTVVESAVSQTLIIGSPVY
jgi:hypothetical protein